MINNVLLVGRVGKEAEVRTLDSGKKVMTFTVATWINVKDDSHESGWKQITEWHNIVCWSDFADRIAEKVKKGALVMVEGSIKHREYEDKEGVKRFITEVVGNVKVINEAKEAKQKEVKAEAVSEKKEVTNGDGMPF